METDSLRWFQQVADGTTVTEVSELEGVTQSGVSRALARLEGEIGTPLLQRSGRILRMTHAGAVFKRHVDAMMHQLDDGIAAVNQLIEPDTGTVALAFQHSLGTWLVPDLVRSFRTAHPHVRFQLTQVRDELHSAPLASGHADLEIGTRRPHDPAVRTRRLALEPLRLALPRDHELAGQPRLRLAEVSDELMVARQRQPQRLQGEPPRARPGRADGAFRSPGPRDRWPAAPNEARPGPGVSWKCGAPSGSSPGSLPAPARCRECWKARATVPVSGSMSWLTAAIPSGLPAGPSSRRRVA